MIYGLLTKKCQIKIEEIEIWAVWLLLIKHLVADWPFWYLRANVDGVSSMKFDDKNSIGCNYKCIMILYEMLNFVHWIIIFLKCLLGTYGAMKALVRGG